MSKISVLSSSDFPYGGAPENFVREMVQGIANILIEEDIEVVLFWGQRNCFYNDTKINCTNYLLNKPIRNEFLKFFELALQIFIIPAFVFKTKFYKKNEMLVLYGLDRFYIVSPIVIFCKIFKLKCVRVITEIYRTEDYTYYWWRKPLYFFNKIQLMYFDKYLDGIVVLSSYLMNYCLKNGVNKKNIFFVTHFINFNNKISNNVTNSNSSFNIVYSGTITYENGITDLIDAYIQFFKVNAHNCSLTIMGKKNPNIYNTLDEIELEKFNIEFTGNLQRDKMFSILHNANLLVNPRRKSILAESGFPTKLGEYFSTKVPVLTTSVGDINIYFKNGHELYLSPPNDPKELSKMLNYIYNQLDERIEVGKNGYKWGKDNLDNVSNAKKLLDFFNIK